MNSTRTSTLLSITLSAVLLTGIIAPSMPKAFAGVECEPFGNGLTAQDDICLPPWIGTGAPNTVFREGARAGFGDAGDCSSLDPSQLPAWQVPNFVGDEDTTNFPLDGTAASISFNPGGATVAMPNLVDQLPFKDIRIQLTFCRIDIEPVTEAINPFVDSITPSEGECSFVADGSAIPTTLGATYFFEDWFCEPNPDSERISIDYNPNLWVLVQVVFDSITYDEEVGGIFEGVNTAALLVAGAQANALWLIPLITAIGIGIVVVNRNRFF